MMKKMICTLPMLAAYFALTACGGSGSDNHMVSDNPQNSFNTSKQNAQLTNDSNSANNNQSNNNYANTSKQNFHQGNNNEVNKKISTNFNSGERELDDVKSASVSINGYTSHTNNDLLIFDYSNLPQGFSRSNASAIIEFFDGNKDKIFSNSMSYNQFYSVVVGFEPKEKYENGVRVNLEDPFIIETIAGQPTPIANLPAQGSATYEGLAFTENAQGNFKYTINFADKTGAGKITGLNAQDIDLLPGHLASAQEAKQYQENEDIEMNAAPQTLFLGNTSPDAYGDYMIGLYGPHAEEATGAVKNNEGYWAVGVGGKRGAIQ